MPRVLRIVAGLLMVLVLLLGLGGCSALKGLTGKQKDWEPGGRLLQDPARVIISLSPGSTEIIALKGGTNFLRARTQSCNYPKFVEKLPVVASVKPNYEKIAEMHPDLVVYDPDLYNANDVAQMRNLTKREPFALGGRTIDEFIDRLYAMGKLYTGETFISDYVDDIESARRTSLADPVQPTPKVALLLPDSSGRHMIAGVNSFQADEIRAATGQPVGPKAEMFVPLNAESLIQMNPDIILTAGSPDPILDDPRFKSLTAVKKNRVRGVLQDVILRRGVRVPLVIEQLHGTFSEVMQ